MLSALLTLAACRSEDTSTPEDTASANDAADADGDGFSGDDDCDDADGTTNPGAVEICDGRDNDCDERVDEDVLSTFYVDADADGYGDPNSATEGCEPGTDAVDNGLDCNDGEATISPAAEEVCNELDDDCDEETDEDVTLTLHPDADADGYGDATSATTGCAEGEGYVLDGTDCDDSSDRAHPGEPEVCDEADNDCDGDVDDGVTTTFFADVDADGFGDEAAPAEACALPTGYAEGDDDCDDTDTDVHPGAVEVCNGKDDDCDLFTDDATSADASDWYYDGDGDGFGDGSATTACDAPVGGVLVDGDCDDAAAAVFPTATEVCNAIDDDCDGVVDEDDAADATTWYGDADGDGWGGSTFVEIACIAPASYVADAGDCDDLDEGVHPEADERCDDVDEDCDGTVDEAAIDPATWYADADGDSFGDAATFATDCDAPSGYVSDATDCEDGNDAVFPGATESCDEIDEDCDGAVDDGLDQTWYADADGDSFGDSSASVVDCAMPADHVADDSDCDDGNDTVFPGATETCDDVDEDCDGAIDDGLDQTWYADADGDSFGNSSASVVDCAMPAGYLADDSDCDDGDDTVFPGATETCDEIDQDCDGNVDEGLGATWYLDADGDGHGDSATTAGDCAAPSGYVASSDDCDDGDDTIFPGAAEGCDGDDHDCDGDVDNDDDGDGFASEDCGGDDCRDDEATLYPESGSCPDGLSCLDILDAGYSFGTGTYTIDPDGSGTGTSPFSAKCEMSMDGGGWTQALQAYIDHLSTSESRNYLYSYGSAWYLSPATTLVWNWSSYQPLSGTYSYSTGSTSATGSLSCSHSEGGDWGVGCSNGGGRQYKVLTIYGSTPSAATGTVCQDLPDVFGVGACRSDTNIWIRP